MYLTPTKSHSDYKRRWYAKNREKRLAQEKIRREDISYQAQTLFRRAKGNAKRKGIEFTIEPTDVVVPEYCPIFHWIKLTAIAGQGFVDSNISLDRKDASKGYIKGNIHVISYKANRNKNNSTLKELVALGEWAHNLLNTHNQPLEL